MLKKFFKMKRNQQVTIFSRNGDETIHTLGKVSAIGRDFVMVTNLKDRIWLPYHAIESANIPQGIPNFSNSHQSFIYDNDLKRKLVHNFGATVSKRDALIQQFYEESLGTNLRSWKNTWVEIRTDHETLFGKIEDSDKQRLLLSLLNEKYEIEIKNVLSVHSIRFFSLVSMLGIKQFKSFLK